MNKNEKAASILKEHQEWRLGGDGEPTNPQALTSAIHHAIDALTQAAEMQAAIVELAEAVKQLDRFGRYDPLLNKTKKWS